VDINAGGWTAGEPSKIFSGRLEERGRDVTISSDNWDSLSNL